MKSFQNSRLILLLQSGSLVFLSVLLGILLMKSLWFCSLFTFFVILLFILHIDKQQQKLTEMVMRLITAIRFSDFSLSFRPGSKKQADPRLTQAMEQALKQFREKMYTLEEQHLYYNTLLSTIDSGILVLNRNGTIEWYNKTVLREFGLTSLRPWARRTRRVRPRAQPTRGYPSGRGTRPGIPGAGRRRKEQMASENPTWACHPRGRRAGGGRGRG